MMSMQTACLAVMLALPPSAPGDEPAKGLSPMGQRMAAYVAQAEKDDPKLLAALASFRKRQQELRKTGWRPPWDASRNVKPRAHYESLSTAQLACECLSTGLWARECMLYDRAAYGIARAAVFHEGFDVLYARKDLWAGIAAAYEDLSAGLGRAKGVHDRMNVLMGLQMMNHAYEFPEFRQRLAGSEARLLAAHLKAFAAVRAYSERTGKLRKAGKKAAFFGPGVAYSLACSSLLLIKRASPAAYPGALRKLSAAQLSFRQPDAAETIRLTDLAAAVVRETLTHLRQSKQPPTSRPASGTP